MFEALPRVSVAPAHASNCFADEVAIDFPSLGSLVERMRTSFLGHESHDSLSAEIRLSRSEARRGVVVPLDVPLRALCSSCGGRGEVWTEPCRRCDGAGAAVVSHHVRVSVPPGVFNGAEFSFDLTTRHAPPTRVAVRVAVA